MSRSFYKFLAFSQFVIFLWTRASSANKLILEDTVLGMSFMYTRNNNSTMTVPCGTPDSTSAFFLFTSHNYPLGSIVQKVTTTNEYSYLHHNALALITVFYTLSNTLLKSSIIAFVWPLSFMTFFFWIHAGCHVTHYTCQDGL